MTDAVLILAIAGATLASLGIVSLAGLRAWSGWLDLRRDELSRRTPAANPAARIELADLRERVRKLEAIAAGVEL